MTIGRRTYLDANLYIYVFEGIETYRTRMAGLLAEIDRQDASVVASELLFTELLPRPMKGRVPGAIPSGSRRGDSFVMAVR